MWVKKEYNRIANRITMPRSFYEKAVSILSKFTRLQFQNILDVGCGNGLLLSQFLESNDENEYCGIDFSEELIKRTKQKIHDKAMLVCGDALKLPFKHSSFDIVTCTEVIEHVNGQMRLLQEIHRVLKPMGLLLITLPNALPFYPFYFIIRKFPRSIRPRFSFLLPYEDEVKTSQPIDHAYTSLQLLKWLRQSGFHVVHTSGLKNRHVSVIFLYTFYTIAVKKNGKCP